MKHTTRILALLLALVLCLGLSVTAFATEAGNATTGNCSITVENAKKDQTYKLYKMLDLSVNVDHAAYSYTVNSEWTNFFGKSGDGIKYVKITDGYVTWNVDQTEIEAFAKDAEEYAKTLNQPVKNYTASADGSYTFSGLDAGYYLVTSTLGTKAAVNTTPGAQNPTIQEKNGVPSNEKKVEEDSEAGKNDAYGYVNDADIGQTVNFQSTITVQAGAENYVFHDTMSEGLTFGTVTSVTLNDKAVAESSYTVKRTTEEGKKDTGCTFEVAFEQTFCDTLNPNDKIVISYSATLNENAVVGNAGNFNESKLTYGENGQFSTTPSKTTTYTWAFDVLKIGDSDHSKPLENAQFVVLNHDKNKVAKFTTDGKFDGWFNIPGEGTEWDTASVLSTNAQGKIHVKGLDSGNYWLKEVKAPDGYNMLKEEKEVAIVKTKAENKLTLSCAPVTVEVNNQSGALLPSTGGMGTTIFYVLGGILAVGAAVLLVTKKRMERG